MVNDYLARENKPVATTTWATLFRVAAKYLLYVPSHRQDSTYHSLCYTSCGALAGMRNSLMGPPRGIDPVIGCQIKVFVWKCGRKEGNVLFNDALKTFYLRLYGVGHMVKDHSDSERGNPLPPHGLLFPINSKGSFICTIPERRAHTMAFVTPVVEHWLCGNVLL